MEQWYAKRKDILQLEKQSMKDIVGEPVWGKNCGTLPDGRFYWDIYLRVKKDAKTSNRELFNQVYHFRLVYEPNHPTNQYGTSIHAYPTYPTDLSFLQNKANRAGRGSIPHLYTDSKGVPYLCTSDLSTFSTTYGQGHVASAKTSYLCLKKWLYTFEAGLIDKYIWEEFKKHNNL